jgi:hypothetical protein
MFRVDTSAALLAMFRPKDRQAVELTRGLKFPLSVRDYIAWTHPAGGKVFLVFAQPSSVPVGIAFETNGGHGSFVPSLCDWCHCAGVGNQVGLLSATLNARRRVGINVCVDLSCKERLEEAANLGGFSPRPAIEKLLERMVRFATAGLQMHVSGSPP